MKIGRSLIRKLELQSKLEQYGFIKLNLLSEQNIKMILDNLKKIETENILSLKREIYDIVLNKINNKVEYNCINCSSLYFKILSPEKNNIYIEESINDEYSFPSLQLYIPLLSNKEEVVINFLSGAKNIYSHPRGENLPNLYQNLNNFDKYMVNERLTLGECIFAYTHIPYMISDFNSDIIWLSVGVLPYESKSLIYKMNDETNIDQFIMKEEDWFKYLYSDEILSLNKYRKFIPSLKKVEYINYEKLEQSTNNGIKKSLVSKLQSLIRKKISKNSEL